MLLINFSTNKPHEKFQRFTLYLLIRYLEIHFFFILIFYTCGDNVVLEKSIYEKARLYFLG